MPYNTRRKSLSLPSLGIHVPVTNAARAATKQAPASYSSTATTTTTSTTTTTTATRSQPLTAPSHSTRAASPFSTSPSSPSSSTSSLSSAASSVSSVCISDTSAIMPSKRAAPADAGSNKRVKRRNSSSASAMHTTTPPASPSRHASVEQEDGDIHAPIDYDNHNDDIVQAVVELLQSTGNRPHLIKELESHLMLRLKCVQQSANPSAIICSRLSSFMKRPCWTATRKCPLAKQLENIHPRRTYYYLTTCRHQPLPDASSVHFIVPRTSIVTPPMSSAPTSSDAAEDERRRELSPSPEVELTTFFDEYDFDADYLMPLARNRVLPYAQAAGLLPAPRLQRGASPPLERDEKEFTQTAEGLQKQKLSGSRYMLKPCNPNATALVAAFMASSNSASTEQLLFGHQSRRLGLPPGSANAAIAALRPHLSAPDEGHYEHDELVNLLRRYNSEIGLGWDSDHEPIGLDELDNAFDGAVDGVVDTLEG